MSHIHIETKSCGEFVVPIDHITVHACGINHRLLIRGDDEWRDLDEFVYKFVVNKLSGGKK